jgi:uncharacterized protein (DUF983 family)
LSPPTGEPTSIAPSTSAAPNAAFPPIFLPLKQTRNLNAWFQPLDGCPRCGYAYEREQGYFLIATWVFNYGVVAGIGLICGLVADIVWKASLPVMFVAIALPMAIASVLIARHAKSLFIALDHYCDPHRPAS